MEPVKTLDEVLDADGTANCFAQGSREAKRELLAAMPPDKLEDVLIAHAAARGGSFLRAPLPADSAARSCF